MDINTMNKNRGALDNKVNKDLITLDDHKKKVKTNVQVSKEDVKDSNVKMPKWKRESEQFRNAMRRAKDPDSVIDVPELDDRVQCKFCKRKFAELT